MLRRPRPQRRTRQRRTKDRRLGHLRVGRVYRIHPDAEDWPRAVVEVRIVRSRVHLAESIRQQGLTAPPAWQQTHGCVQSFNSRFGRPAYVNGRIVAQMWLCAKDVQSNPADLIAHECGHAAMAWARLRAANLGKMPGEEVMCYALVRMANQVNRALHAYGLWP